MSPDEVAGYNLGLMVACFFLLWFVVYTLRWICTMVLGGFDELP